MDVVEACFIEIPSTHLLLHSSFYKWKNHFPEMKGYVGMSPHEKEREQEGAHPKTESHPTPSLHLLFFIVHNFTY